MPDPVTPAPEIAPERRAAVERARQLWIRRLIDVSRRNNLLYFRPLKRGTLDLTGASKGPIQQILAGGASDIRDLLPEADQNRIAGNMTEIGRRALLNREERNLETLFLAFGLATWKADDGGRPAEAPVLMLPVAVEKAQRASRLGLRATGDLQLNPVLVHVMGTVHGCSFVEDEILSLRDTSGDPGSLDLEATYRLLEDRARGIPEFAVKPKIVLGNFSFHKMAMVRDLNECSETLAQHPLVAALAGDVGARAELGQRSEPSDGRELDRTHPDDEFLVRDADSSQQRVVAAVSAGQDGVIQGPPGTGKSQTIANVIATQAAAGKRVLFVAQKRAALEVVLTRLEEVGLGHLALDLHGAELSRREVMAKFSDSLRNVREAAGVDADELHRRFEACRTRLNEHVTRMHATRSPSGLSVFELQAQLVALDQASSRFRWRGQALDPFDSDRAKRIREVLADAARFGDLLLQTSSSPWNIAELKDGHAAIQALDLAGRLANERLPHLIAALGHLAVRTGLPAPITWQGAKDTLSLCSEIAGALKLYKSTVFGDDLDSNANALRRARSRLSATWARCTSAAFRAARRSALSNRLDPKVTSVVLASEIGRAAHAKKRWLALGGQGIPGGVETVDALQAKLATAFSDIDALAALVGLPDLRSQSFEDLAHLARALSDDSSTARQLPRVCQLRAELRSLGVGPMFEELREIPRTEAAWVALFDHAWLTSCLDRVRADDPALDSFIGAAHDSVVDEFRRLDGERLRIAAARVRRAHAERAVAVMNAQPREAQLVRNESNKKARHWPLRRLFESAGDALTALRPCWMVSPLSVAELLPAMPHFDLVLFDEASQVLPEDAVCAILRGRRGVVAGDQHQLPPTAFFASGEEDDDGPEDNQSLDAAGFESILDLMATFLDPWSLDWHYRSLDESLIAFSNRYIYGDRMITFPGTGGSPAVTHVLVNQPVPRDGEEDSVTEEVRRVVALVEEHAATRPSESLGVITMGIAHQYRIQAALDAGARENADLAVFLDEGRSERFFVKNLERVQGDEREAIILSIGYGKDRSGRLPYRFGPLLYQGGERRLNVAITRARRRMTVVSSFSHLDMDPGRSNAAGVELLRLYLEFAASNGRNLGDRGISGEPLKVFEASVFDALTARGCPLLTQWGSSRYRIDLVAQHPRNPGRLVLAIECDGASYHSSPTARDRDRLRQQHLEQLGWRFHRIWSTDWFLRREEEIERALLAYERAVRAADDLERQETTIGQPEEIALPTTAAIPARRPARPAIPRRGSIYEYSDAEVGAIVTWLQSDGRLLTDDELVTEVKTELGFQRLGSRIESAIRRSIDRVRGFPH